MGQLTRGYSFEDFIMHMLTFGSFGVSFPFLYLVTEIKLKPRVGKLQHHAPSNFWNYFDDPFVLLSNGENTIMAP